MKEGTLEFDESMGKFCIANEAENSIICHLEFGDRFEVMENDVWVETCLEISQNDMGEMIFKLKGTSYSEFVTGIPSRPLSAKA